MELLSQGFNPNKSHTFFEIPCSECDSLDDLLELMYEKLDFPDYFWMGNTWDSLVDCLMPMPCTDADSISIYFSGFQQLSRKLDPKDLGDLIQTFRFVVDHCHQTTPTPQYFRIVMD